MITRPIALASVACGLAAATLHGQQTRPDSVRADSLRRLQTVTVTRTDERASRLPWATAVQTATDVQRGQATLGVDEALNNIPGVVVSNRYIYALDQRLSIRGAGSRANFGTRGVKVLLDGVPQSLPDGQTQLTNIELGAIGRIEVLRGAASSLYGNGSGGVISFESDMRAPDRVGQEVRVTSGSFGMNKVQTRTTGRTDHAIGMLSLSRTTVDGFRQFSAADVRNLNGAVDYFLGGRSRLELRANIAAVPVAKNPGALTKAEWDANPDSAASTNVARGASREVAQHQYSAGWHLVGEDGDGVRAITWYLTRTVDNALATAPTPPGGPTNGTYNNIERQLAGARIDATRTFGTGESAPRFTGGVDAIRSHDDRRNWRSTGGRPTALIDTLLQNQAEIVSSVGPFAQLSWSPTAALQTSVGVRYDEQRFEVQDHFFADGKDNSGDRTMSAASGHIGASYSWRTWLIPYANVATAFETPTTTELNSRPDGSGGFNPDLNPQRIATVELGARGAAGRWGYDVSVFRSRTRHAIIQYQSSDGRSFFQNAGSTNSTGAEIGVHARVTSWMDAQLAYTLSHFVFGEYRITHAAAPTDTLDGNRLAGVPDRFVRAGVRTKHRQFALDADWTWSGALFADDLNTLTIPDWGRGRFDARLSWSGKIAGQRAEPFIAVDNACDQKYVGSVTLNGTFGRVRESAPGRNWYAGLELGWSVLK